MIMNSTVSPTRPIADDPTVRMTLMMPSSVSYSACLVRMRSTCVVADEGGADVAGGVRIGEADLEAARTA